MPSSASRTSATARTSARRTPTRPAWTSSPARSTRKSELAYFKTHHYGGIRKYHWVTIPLELHGVVVRGDGSTVAVHIGADEGDPQFIINDLLPHLGREQGKKPLNEAIPSESLNLLVGGRPLAGEDCSDRFKLNVLKLLNEKYGIVEEDLISAELEVVPAGKARDIGFDRSFIASYGHDDRVCAYAELAGIFDAKSPKRTAVCIFADKEEIGSEGVSGMLSQAFDKFMADLCEAQGVALRDCLANSFCLSADVTAAYDPNFADVYDKRNAAFVNYGVGLCKYTGAGGKSGARPTPPPRSWAACVSCSTTTACSGRWPSSARRTRAAAARSPSSWRSATSTRSTRAFPCSPCTRPTRRSPSSTAI